MSRSHQRLGLVLGLVSASVGGSFAAGCSGGSSGTADAAPHADASMIDGGGIDGSIDATVPDGKLHIFDDNYGADLTYAPFGGSVGAPSVDSTEHHSGTASLKIVVPATGYVGGTMTVPTAIDLSHYDAVTFYAKASKAAILDKAGFGIDNETNLYTAELAPIPLTTEWQQFIVPIPLASRLSAEKGLFHFADAAANDGGTEGYTVWIDDVVYETLPTGALAAKTPAIATETVSKLVGDTYNVNGTSVAWVVNGATPAQVVAVGRSYFDYTSSDPNVATVDAHGEVTAVAVGTTTITAKLGDLDANGSVTLTVLMPTAPDTGPTAPTALPADVISLFSNAYTSVPVDSFCTTWSDATLTSVQIAGDDIKKYTSLKFAGLEFYATASVDATMMTHFHVDFWTPDATAFKVKLVDFGANGVYQNGPGNAGSDDVESELTFDAASTPALVPNTWISLDLPLTSFTALTTKAHLAQLILTSTNSTVYVDNLYFHK